MASYRRNLNVLFIVKKNKGKKSNGKVNKDRKFKCVKLIELIFLY